MATIDRREAMWMVGGAVVAAATVGRVGVAGALELNKPAPDFTLPSHTGEDVSVKQFRGKKLVLFDFFGAAFAPT